MTDCIIYNAMLHYINVRHLYDHVIPLADHHFRLLILVNRCWSEVIYSIHEKCICTFTIY